MQQSTKNAFLLLAVVGMAVLFFYFAKQNAGCEGIHFHPHLEILIDGQPVPIPTDIGITVGNSMDNDLSGMRMSPTHTHSSDGVIHMENLCPQKKPETLTLGYFFKAWGKRFNAACIFDHCNDGEKRVRMTVNGKENSEFYAYKMQDRDELIISYGK